MVATVHQELVARQGDDRGGRAPLEIEDRQSSACLDLELAVLDGDLKIGRGAGAWRTDRGADDRQLDRRVLPLARDPQPDLSVGGPAHPLERLVEGHPSGRHAIDLRDDVIGHDAGPGGGRAPDRRDDLEQTILQVDVDAQSAERLVLVARAGRRERVGSFQGCERRLIDRCGRVR